MQQSFMVAMKNYFGLLEGQQPMEFGRDVLNLPYKDKIDCHAMLTAEGLDVTPPVEKK